MEKLLEELFIHYATSKRFILSFFMIIWHDIIKITLKVSNAFTAHYPTNSKTRSFFFHFLASSNVKILFHKLDTNFISFYIYFRLFNSQKTTENNKRNWENEARAEMNDNSIPLIKEAKRIMPKLLAQNFIFIFHEHL